MSCPCGIGEEYKTCCGPFHSGNTHAPTAEALMRSRYCAFVKQEIAYLKDTTWPSRRDGFKDASFATRAANSTWLGLTVHEVEEGDPEANRGTVTFTARSLVNGALQEQTEKSLFKKKNGRWYYVKPLD